MSLTEEQRQAVKAEGSVAVVAGAGTGKTHMLTERYLHHLSQDGYSPLDVVAVTFTNKAAAELRTRVRERVQERMSEREDILAELEAAQISTLHSLCGRICQEHPEEAGVPADFTVLDELRGRLWTADRLTDALELLPSEHYVTLPYPLMQATLEDLLADPIAAEHALERALDGGPEEWETLVTEVRRGTLESLLQNPELKESREVLTFYQGSPNDRMEAQRQAALSALSELDDALRSDADVKPSLDAIDGLKLTMGSVRNWGEGELEAVKEAIKVVHALVRCELERKLITLRGSVAAKWALKAGAFLTGMCSERSSADRYYISCASCGHAVRSRKRRSTVAVSVENPLRKFCTRAWPRTTVSADAGCLKPRTGPSHCLR
jgi:ATP-dependent helicase/nuclease subunit A